MMYDVEYSPLKTKGCFCFCARTYHFLFNIYHFDSMYIFNDYVYSVIHRHRGDAASLACPISNARSRLAAIDRCLVYLRDCYGLMVRSMMMAVVVVAV